MRILWAGDSPTVHTGFGIVSDNILKRLHAKGHDITVLGINHFGEPYDQTRYPFPIYGMTPGGHVQLYGLDKLWPLVEHVKPDLLFFLNDPWLIEDFMKRKSNDYPYMKTAAYYPTDAGPMKPQWVEMLSGFNAQICYSKYAEGVVTESNNGIRPKNLYQIYHGVDTQTYKPVNQQKARAELGLPVDAFIVGMVARNQPRKRFDILMKAFKEFAKDKPEAKLYLHTAMQDFGFDMPDLIHQLGLADKLILTEGITPAKGVEPERLNLIYNTFDVNTLISLGDGFGLPVAESMATACPQLVSDHSCLKELVEGHGGLTVKNAAWLLNSSSINTWGGLSDIDDLVDKLNLLYSNQDLRIKLSKDAFEYITQPQFNWDYVGDQFESVIKKIFHLL